MDLAKIESKLGIKFHDQNLLLEALTHRSFVGDKEDRALQSYERLEFLGDSILTYVVGEYFYYKFPGASEGELTKYRSRVVQGTTLEFISREIGLEAFVRIGESVKKDKKFHLPLDDVYEAVIGAIYLDQGLGKVGNFIRKTLLKNAETFISSEDSKTRLQELVQKKYATNAITYVLDKIEGPADHRQFYVKVKIHDTVYASGHGSSKQKAEKMAASLALERIQNGEE